MSMLNQTLSYMDYKTLASIYSDNSSPLLRARTAMSYTRSQVQLHGGPASANATDVSIKLLTKHKTELQ